MKSTCPVSQTFAAYEPRLPVPRVHRHFFNNPIHLPDQIPQYEKQNFDRDNFHPSRLRNLLRRGIIPIRPSYERGGLFLGFFRGYSPSAPKPPIQMKPRNSLMWYAIAYLLGLAALVRGIQEGFEGLYFSLLVLWWAIFFNSFTNFLRNHDKKR